MSSTHNSFCKVLPRLYRFLVPFMLLILTMENISTPVHATANIIYVTSTGTSDGSTWSNAANLQDAILTASSGDEIWVAAGTYYPDEGSVQSDNDRSASFNLKDRVAIYGGFTGTETQRSQRDWQVNLVILSGDIEQDDTTSLVTDPDRQIVGNNSYHVVKSDGVSNSAILDGFTITAGANYGADSPDNRGGGIYNGYRSNATFANLTVTGNIAFLGGGIHSDGDSAFTNLMISNNSAMLGGGMYIGGSPTFTDVTVRNNNTDRSGGGIYIVGKSPTFTNITISNNTARTCGDGGGIYNISGGTFINIAITENSTVGTGRGGGISTSGGMFTNVTIAGNSSNSSGGGIFNRGIVSFTNMAIIGNTAENGGGVYNDDEGSPTLINATVAGNSASNLGGGISTEGSITVANSIIWSNHDHSGTETMNSSAIINGSGSLEISYSLVQNWNPSGTGNLNGTLASNDPLFADPINSDEAPTTAGSYRLNDGSPAIDVGDNSLILEGITTDLDGAPRIVNDIINLGAYESVGSIPTTPSNLTANPLSSTQVEITWSDQSDNEVGFQIERSIADTFHWQTLTTVDADVAYYIDTVPTCEPVYYRVQAYNSIGYSPESNTVSVLTPPCPVQEDKIAFTSYRDGNANIYLISPDGSGLVQLTDHAATDEYPAWSPDGNRLVFVSNRTFGDQIFMLNVEDSHLTQLTDGNNKDEPVWSPDGSQIAFTSWDNIEREVFVMNADGSNIVQLTDRPGYDNTAPDWSPNGNQFAFQSSPFGSSLADIYVMDTDGSNPTNLTGTPDTAEYEPVWSPNGSQIAFSGIHVMNVDEVSAPTLLTNFFGREPVWSPDGSKLAFTAYRDGNTDIYVIDADGSNQIRLTTSPGIDSQPHWRPQFMLPPDNPISLTATAVSQVQINLSWSDNSDNENGFKIERSTSGDNGSWSQIVTLDEDAESYNDSDLNCGITYYYRVRAYNETGSSLPSDSIRVRSNTCHIIEGSVQNTEGIGIGDVVISSDTGITTTTNSNGSYTLLLATGTYTLTAAKANCTFYPTSLIATVPPNITGQNFTATCIAQTASISGQVTDESGSGISGVIISNGMGSTTTTASDGTYMLSELISGTYTLTPSLSNYTFNPVSQTISVPPGVERMDFIGAPRNSGTLTITGKVTTTEGTGLAGVLIATNDEQTATTDSNGNYTLRGLVEGNYTLTPTLAGYIFDPINRTVSVRHDTEGVNFIATPASTQLNMNLAVSALITVTVVDEDGAALANEPVDFSTDYGTVLPASTMTDEQGGATVVVVAEDTPGTATVTMTVDGMSESMSVRFGEITDIPAIYLPLIER